MLTVLNNDADEKMYMLPVPSNVSSRYPVMFVHVLMSRKRGPCVSYHEMLGVMYMSYELTSLSPQTEPKP